MQLNYVWQQAFSLTNSSSHRVYIHVYHNCIILNEFIHPWSVHIPIVICFWILFLRLQFLSALKCLKRVVNWLCGSTWSRMNSVKYTDCVNNIVVNLSITNCENWKWHSVFTGSKKKSPSISFKEQVSFFFSCISRQLFSCTCYTGKHS